MTNKKTELLEKLSWQKIKTTVKKINPSFAKMINSLNPHKDHPFYRISYPFGQHILEMGHFCLPSTSGQSIPVDNANIPAFVKDDLQHACCFMVLNNSAEIFTNSTKRISTLKLIGAGELFFTDCSHILHSSIWNVTSGARSLFILPKIADTSGHKRLKQLGAKSSISKNLTDQWLTFSELTQHKNFPEPWQTDVLIFPKFDFASNELACQTLQYHLLTQSLMDNDIWQQHLLINLSWDSFVLSLDKPFTRLSPYLVDTIKYLLAIGIRKAPGFAPAITSESAPILGLQQVYMDEYNLKNYVPTFMQPAYLSLTQAVYYSLQLPTAYASLPEPHTAYSNLDKMRQLRALLEQFLKNIQQNKSKSVANAPLAKLLEQVQFDYFHSEQDLQGEIRPSKIMPQEDPNLLYCPQSKQQRGFSEVSPFVRGCIRISIKERESSF